MKKFLKYLKDNEFTVYAASITYYAFLGIIPYVFVAVRLFAAFGIKSDSFISTLPDSGGFLSEIIARTNAAKTGESVASFLVTFYSSTTCFYQLKKITGTTFKERLQPEKKRNVLVLRIWATLVMVVIQLIFVASAVIGIIANKFFDKAIYSVLTYFLTLVCTYLSIVVTNLFVVERLSDLKTVFLGSLVVLALWSFITAGFTVYVNFIADFTRLYGAFSFVIIFFIWLYLLMLGLVAGVSFITYFGNVTN